MEVLMLTVDADEAKVFESIRNGAVGYLLEKTRAPKLLEAIREAAAEQRDDLARDLRRHGRGDASHAERAAPR